MKQFTKFMVSYKSKYIDHHTPMEKMSCEYIPSIISTCSPDSNVVSVLAIGGTVLLDGSHMEISHGCTTTVVKIIAGSVTKYQVRSRVYKFC
jgi:hypothetical protein